SNTPIQVGDTLYSCTPFNKIYAINAETGEERWSYDSKATSPAWQRCRGVAYYESETAVEECRTRIVMSTIDARLIEVDAETGTPCPQFGDNGQLDLRIGMGEVKPGFYYTTSQPTVTEGLVILGGFVADNVEVGEPSGVVRAFSAETGDLVWAWDLGNPANTGAAPPEGYTRGTPNMWSNPAVDEDLGMIYLPIGNSTPDFWGGQRTEAADAYNTSVAALDIRTGREVWHQQLVHHDLWDYDNASQPALYDFQDGTGGTTPAVIQMTKTGQIFVMDRRTGEMLIDVEERPVPAGKAEGERYSPTQPFAVGMPMIGSTTLTEADMWGATPIDQMLCRIAFRELRYDGPFTPPGEDASLLWPGFYGGMNWGSASIDPARDYLIFNDIRVAQRIQLIPREQTQSYVDGGGHSGFSGQTGTPYGVTKVNFMSPLGIPCQKPPFGTMTAVDLKTRQIAWQVPLGTVQDTGPLGIKMGLPIPVGMPTLGGPVTTSGGVVFFAGTQDFYLRAMDVETGKELWKARLPVGANATPMSYVSPESGDQFVVISAGGARDSADVGDYVIAYKLKK
ncbi:MAG: PQQ-binding-like beta-propeller repeat protein, partial [Pseudomonadota bacterium]|nr:PQQ-binding-like beta-propeller repeat protein [Pseudomonadota bacterium]